MEKRNHIMKSKPQQRKVNYRAFFILGITFFPIGIATANPAFMTLGLVFLAISLKNRENWDTE
jgi:hypothetical protein